MTNISIYIFPQVIQMLRFCKTAKIAFKVKIVKISNILGIKTQILVCNMNKLSQIKDIDEFYQVKLIETAKIGDT